MFNIGMHLPEFSLQSTMGEISSSHFLGSYIVMICLPSGFTPVSTSELVELSKLSREFSDRNTQILGINTESNTSNLAWLHAIKMSTGMLVPFPVLSDKKSDVLKDFLNNTQLCSMAIIIDDRGIIRTILTYPESVGKNIKEILRIIDALKIVDKTGMHTPVAWENNHAAMLPAPKTLHELMSREEAMDENYCDDWYMCYSEEHKKIPQ